MTKLGVGSRYSLALCPQLSEYLSALRPSGKRWLSCLDCLAHGATQTCMRRASSPACRTPCEYTAALLPGFPFLALCPIEADRPVRLYCFGFGSAKCSAISRVRLRRPTPSHTSRPVCPHRPQTNQPKSVLCHDSILRTPACLWHLSQPERKRECLFARCDPQLGVCRKPVYAPKLLGTLQHASRACAWRTAYSCGRFAYSAL